MKVGDSVKLSEAGLQYLYAYPSVFMEKAKVRRGRVSKFEGEIVTIRRTDALSHNYDSYHITFLEMTED